MPLNIPRIKALCFDVDGTLSDTDDLYVRKVTRFFPRFLFRNPDQTARRFVMWVEAPGNALLGFADTIGLDDEMAYSSLRFGLGRFTTKEEIDYVMETVTNAISRIRQESPAWAFYTNSRTENSVR